MAQDWIKMRTDLYRDPRVCLMAEHLMDPDSDLARYVNQNMQRDMTVTRNVMRNVTVGALLSIWGVMRVRGKANGVDLVCRGVGVAVLDDIADLQGIGAAMESVGWVVESPEGIVFPRFFEENNVDPEAASKEKAAARQKRFRERQKQESYGNSDVTGDVTVTHREEKRREENNTVVPLPTREAPPISNDPAIQLSVALRRQGINVTFTHPAVQDWTTKGVTVEMLTEAVASARITKPNGSIPANYLVPIVNALLNPPLPLKGSGPAAPLIQGKDFL